MGVDVEDAWLVPGSCKIVCCVVEQAGMASKQIIGLLIPVLLLVI